MCEAITRACRERERERQILLEREKGEKRVLPVVCQTFFALESLFIDKIMLMQILDKQKSMLLLIKRADFH